MIDPFAAVAGCLLLVAATWDVARFRIPNLLCAALAGLFALRAVLLPDAAEAVRHLLPAGTVFAVTALLFARGLIGGGDVKLLAAATLWVPPAAVLPQMLAVTGIGALLAIGVAVLRWVVRRALPLPADGEAALPEVLRDGAPLPYGVAIAAGTLLHLPWTL